MPEPGDLERQPVEPEAARRATAITAAGITTMPIAGIASRLAISPYWATVLKWKAEIGAVAAPATSEVMAIPTIGFANRQPGAVWVCLPPGPPAQRLEDGDQRDRRREGHLEPRPASGSPARAASTISAASATERMVSAGRSSSTATSTVAVIT